KYKEHDGIVEIKAWINSGELKVGDDIMYLMVAGRFRTDVFPIFEAVLSAIKKEVVTEMED
ncbi:MAG: molybdenum cofactor biosynthesis protein MoaE, partial [Desulfuromonadaceae bacterium]